MLKSYILLIFGILTISVGSLGIYQSKNDKKFYNSMNDLYQFIVYNHSSTSPQPPTIPLLISWEDTWQDINNEYSTKLGFMSLYGLLTLVYGLVITSLAIYEFSSGNEDVNPKVIGAIALIGFLLMITAVLIKQHNEKGRVAK